MRPPQRSTVRAGAGTPLINVDAVIPSIQGPGVGIGTWINQLASYINEDSTSTAASATVTIGGTAHAGDVITVTISSIAVSYTDTSTGGVGTGTLTVGGTVQVGDVLEATVAGHLTVYQLAAGDTTAALAAASLAAALNADTTFAASFGATSAAGVVTITAKTPGAAGNVSLAANVGGHLPTTTLTASGAALTGGGAGDTLASIAAGIAAAIAANTTLAYLVTATVAGDVVTITAVQKGTNANSITLSAAVTGTGATVTATASAATLGASTAGTGEDDILLAY